MASERVITQTELSEHSQEKDCWIVLGNEKTGGEKVYNVTKYLNEHPGGPEIILEFGGKYADDMFEDIGHSVEARTKMKEFFIGTFKGDESGVRSSRKKSATDVNGKKGGLNPLAILALLIAIAIGIYYSQMKK